MLGDINSAHTQRWARGLGQFDHVVHVVSLSPPNENSQIDGISYSDLGISAKWSKGTSTLNKVIYLSAWLRLQRKIKDFQPTFIHAHFASSYGLLALISIHRPYYISLWGSDIMEFPFRTKLHKLLLGFVLRNSKRVFSTSVIMQNLADDLYNIKAYRIPFGIDPKQFSSTAARSKSPIVIGVIKRLESIYAIDILIRAFARVISTAHTELELRIVGNGSKKHELQRLVSELDISSSVVFIDRVPYDQVPNELRSFHIFANLSRRESFGVSVLEASASGLPVLVSDIKGLEEVYIKDETALIAEVDNVEDTAQKLSKLVNASDLRERLGENGREFVKSNFDWAENLKSLNSFYVQDFKTTS